MSKIKIKNRKGAFPSSTANLLQYSPVIAKLRSNKTTKNI